MMLFFFFFFLFVSHIIRLFLLSLVVLKKNWFAMSDQWFDASCKSYLMWWCLIISIMCNVTRKTTFFGLIHSPLRNRFHVGILYPGFQDLFSRCSCLAFIPSRSYLVQQYHVVSRCFLYLIFTLQDGLSTKSYHNTRRWFARWLFICLKVVLHLLFIKFS